MLYSISPKWTSHLTTASNSIWLIAYTLTHWLGKRLLFPSRMCCSACSELFFTLCFYFLAIVNNKKAPGTHAANLCALQLISIKQCTAMCCVPCSSCAVAVNRLTLNYFRVVVCLCCASSCVTHKLSLFLGLKSIYTRGFPCSAAKWTERVLSLGAHLQSGHNH